MSATAVRERPIIMAAESVRAILDGRKTQLRRVVKPPHNYAGGARGWSDTWRLANPAYFADRWTVFSHPGGGFMAVDVPDADPARFTVAADHGFLCPYGQPGDRLWVRETWRDDVPLEPGGEGVAWKADRAVAAVSGSCLYALPWKLPEAAADWRSPVTMPRWASRLTLEITDVRVERVQEISRDDAFAEGVDEMALIYRADDDAHNKRRAEIYERFGQPCGDSRCADARDVYAHAWDALNAKRGFGWDANPWVWCVTFRRIESQEEA